MAELNDHILIWLPSPMGDAILCTPALRAIRQHKKNARITFLANSVTREILTPGAFNDDWIVPNNITPLSLAQTLRKQHISEAILFKNSFGSALTVALAGIPSRIGYARQGRSFLLTQKLRAPTAAFGTFTPRPMTDYYLALASELGSESNDKTLSLTVAPESLKTLKQKLPQLFCATGPIVVLVPGGAFGQSKCWPAERFSETAEQLIDDHNAIVVVSVAPNRIEQKIAQDICNRSQHDLINLSDHPVTPGELKALFSAAELVITNDTGPRHISLALNRKTITLFGPNDPAWTQTDSENEIQIIGNTPCAPCAKSVCRKYDHLCLKAITSQQVQNAARQLLANTRERATITIPPKPVQIAPDFFVLPEYVEPLSRLGVDSIDSLFGFKEAEHLTKKNLASFRSRLKFNTTSPNTTLFLKRFDSPPIRVQIQNWLAHRKRISCADSEREPATELVCSGINTPKIIAFGSQWTDLAERRSFILTEQIPNAEALERKLPDSIGTVGSPGNINGKRQFIASLADFVRRFHATGYRHRDLYLAHIFFDNEERFSLIDLARAFRPILMQKRYRIKDLAQLYYSAPGPVFSRTDRLRFYLHYAGHENLTNTDKKTILSIVQKAGRMARHDKKHGRTAPFMP